MSESLSSKTSAYHDALKVALAPLAGRTITLAEARTALLRHLPTLEPELAWVMLSDHCENHVPKGSCVCAGTSSALVERIGHNTYRVR